MSTYQPGSDEPDWSTDSVTATTEVINDGKHVLERVSGNFDGGSHHKTMTLGYNRLLRQFDLVTVDSYDPVSLLHRGHSTPDGLLRFDAVYFSADDSEPGFTAIDLRTVITPEMDGRRSLEIWYSSPDVSEYRFLRYAYVRR